MRRKTPDLQRTPRALRRLARRTGEDLEAVIFDQSAGERVCSAPARREYSYPIVAIDGDLVYSADADEGPTHVVDLASGEVTDLPRRTER